MQGSSGIVPQTDEISHDNFALGQVVLYFQRNPLGHRRTHFLVTSVGYFIASKFGQMFLLS
jgi:hypothetical protein